MGLAQFQAAIARLCSDASLRERLRSSPTEAALALGLSSEETRELERHAADSLDAFARGLRTKRFQDVAKLLPRTVRALGPAGRRLFDEHLDRLRGEGVFSSIREDAIGFARFVRRHGNAAQWIGDVAAFEAAPLELRASGRWFRIVQYRCDPTGSSTEPDLRTLIELLVRMPSGRVRRWRMRLMRRNANAGRRGTVLSPLRGLKEG